MLPSYNNNNSKHKYMLAYCTCLFQASIQSSLKKIDKEKVKHHLFTNLPVFTLEFCILSLWSLVSCSFLDYLFLGMISQLVGLTIIVEKYPLYS